MTPLKLKIAHGLLKVPNASPPELKLDFENVEKNRNERALKEIEFDVAEISFSYYLLVREQGATLIALPVFPYRTFWQRLTFCRRESPLQSFSDLAGKRILLPRISNTLAVWALGDLESFYGLPVEKIHWFTQGKEEYGYTIPSGWRVDVLSGEPPQALLERGTVDAAIVPRDLAAENSGIRCVAENFKPQEELYFQNTRRFPILHSFVIREEISRDHPWVAAKLAEALRGVQSRDSMDLSTVGSPWQGVMESFLVYAHRFGLTRRLWKLDEVFVA